MIAMHISYIYRRMYFISIICHVIMI